MGEGRLSSERERIAEDIARIWGEVLAAPVEDDADFFLLGGHSLLGVQVLARIDERLGVRVPLRLLLEHPRLDSFAEAVADLSSVPR